MSSGLISTQPAFLFEEKKDGFSEGPWTHKLLEVEGTSEIFLRARISSFSILRPPATASARNGRLSLYPASGTITGQF